MLTLNLQQALGLLLCLLITTSLASAVGLAWSGILLKKDNLFDWLVPHIRKIRNRPLRNLIQCHKCVSGQFALWWAIFSIWYYDFDLEPMVLFAALGWIMLVIVVTDALYPALKLDLKPGVPLECPPCPPAAPGPILGAGKLTGDPIMYPPAFTTGAVSSKYPNQNYMGDTYGE
jgi:hypothetical protein